MGHKKGHWKKIGDTEFKRIKVLTEAKIPTAMVSRATNRSYYVIQLIERAKDLDMYKKLMWESANGVHVNKKQSRPDMSTLGTEKPEERYPHIVALLDSIVKQQILLLQDTDKIKRRLFITN